MKLELVTVVLVVLVHTGFSIMIYEWQREWDHGVFTRELAQVIPDTKQIIHSATDRSVRQYSPSISLSLYDLTSEHFPNGVRVIRPLLSDGHQVCFIGHISGFWSTDYNIVNSRQGATIPVDFPQDVYHLITTFPGDFDPLAIPNIRDFCDVDRDHIFYMIQTADSASDENTVLDIQGLFEGNAIIVAAELEQTILDVTMVCGWNQDFFQLDLKCFDLISERRVMNI